MSDAAPQCGPGLGPQAAAASGSVQGDGEATMHTAVGQLTYRRAVSKKLVRSTWCDGTYHVRPLPASVAAHPPTQHVFFFTCCCPVDVQVFYDLLCSGPAQQESTWMEVVVKLVRERDAGVGTAAGDR